MRILAIFARNCDLEIENSLLQVKYYKNLFSEIILINNKSTDSTLEKAIKWRERNKVDIKIFNNSENYGLGGSHKIIFKYAKSKNADELILFHGDNQTKLESIIPYLGSGEIYLGSRFINKLKNNDYSSIRQNLNKLLNLFFRIRFGRKIYDMGSGLNLYSSNVIYNFENNKYPNDMSFNYYHLVDLVKNKFDIKWFPIEWKNSRSESNMKFLPLLYSTIRLYASRVPTRFNENNEFLYEVI